MSKSWHLNGLFTARLTFIGLNEEFTPVQQMALLDKQSERNAVMLSCVEEHRICVFGLENGFDHHSRREISTETYSV